MWILRAVKRHPANISCSEYCGYQDRRFIWDHKFARGSNFVGLLLVWLIVLLLHGISTCDGLNRTRASASNKRQVYQTEGGFLGLKAPRQMRRSQASESSEHNETSHTIWRGDDCGCWNSSADGHNLEVECKCNGSALNPNLPSDVYRLTIANANNFMKLSNGQLLPYGDSLREIVLSELPLFQEIQNGSFIGMKNLDTIYIHDAPSLVRLSIDVFKCYLPKLKIIRIHHSSLAVVPILSQLSTSSDNILNAVDLENNKIKTIEVGWIRNLKVDHLALSYNSLEEIGPKAFEGATIATLTLKGNRKLTTLHSEAFLGIHSLRQLDLSETAITLLPTLGLDRIETLRLENVLTLTVIPSIYHFHDLHEAWLTFPYHCCAFEFPETHDPVQAANYNEFVKKNAVFCAGESDKEKADDEEILEDTMTMGSKISTESRVRVLRHSHVVKEKANRRIGITTSLNSQQNGNDMRERRNVWSSSPTRSRRGIGESNGERNRSKISERAFHYTTTTPAVLPGLYPFDESDPFKLDKKKTFGSSVDQSNSDRDKTLHNWDTQTAHGHGSGSSNETGWHESVSAPPPVTILCGNVTVKRATMVRCHPQPDAFNPCEDIMGNKWLRGGVWVVVSLALIGNTAVLVVLLFAPGRMSVQRFLMANLSFADLCMGLYLLMVATEDLISLGSYFNFAIQWQRGWGCQVAGFFTVFASELSVFTLAVITGERWYALTRAIHLTKRLTISGAAQLMSVGWILAITLSVLPLLGVSSYSKTSICLPMESSSTAARAYLAFLLIFNAVAFTLVAFAYFQMYRAVAGHNGHGAGTSATRAADAAVAKKMALLVFTDFACWAPVAFFGLTAVSHNPLIGVTDSKILLVFFYPLNACCNPYLYAILTKQYRRDLLLLLSRHGLCTRRAARYKTGQTGSTNNTMHTMQTILRFGSMAETKVLTNGGHNSSITSIPGASASQFPLQTPTGQGGINFVTGNNRVNSNSKGSKQTPVNLINNLELDGNSFSRNDNEDEHEHGANERLLAETSFISVPVPASGTNEQKIKNISWHPRGVTADNERILVKFRLDTVESCGDAEDDNSDSIPICSVMGKQ